MEVMVIKAGIWLCNIARELLETELSERLTVVHPMKEREKEEEEEVDQDASITPV
jgi:hypothetical protein